jgi:hypothetical protein
LNNKMGIIIKYSKLLYAEFHRITYFARQFHKKKKKNWRR